MGRGKVVLHLVESGPRVEVPRNGRNALDGHDGGGRYLDLLMLSGELDNERLGKYKDRVVKS